jgi:hypothetical protein
MGFDRLQDLLEIARSKDDSCDIADEKAMIEIEWQGSYMNPEHDQKTFELWEDVWREYCRPYLNAAE